MKSFLNFCLTIGFIFCVLASSRCEKGREDHWLIMAAVMGIARIDNGKD